MSQRVRRGLVVAAMALLYLLHQDDWLADKPQHVLGLPVSLAWHVGLCLAASAVLLAAVHLAWPDDASGDPDRESSS